MYEWSFIKLVTIIVNDRVKCVACEIRNVIFVLGDLPLRSLAPSVIVT